MIEYFFAILLEEISMLLERSDEVQNYIEDCEVCCQPIQDDIYFKEFKKDLMSLDSFIFYLFLYPFYVILAY